MNGYTDPETAETLGYSPSTIRRLRYKHGIPSGTNFPRVASLPCRSHQGAKRSILEVDVKSNIVLTKYSSQSAAARAYGGADFKTITRRIKTKKVINGVYLVYEDEYLKQ